MQRFKYTHNNKQLKPFILNLFNFSSVVSGAAFPDPAGRYRRGGGLNVPVEIRLKLRSIESAKIQEKLSSNEILYQVQDVQGNH